MEMVNWDILYPKLLAYTDYLLKTKGWFRTTDDGAYLKGKQAADYVMDAIEVYLTHPDKYDEDAGLSLLNYLKLHIIRRLVSNDVKSKEHELATDILGCSNSNQDHDDPLLFVEHLLPVVEALFPESIDYKNFLTTVTKEVKDDPIAAVIFEGLAASSKR